MKWAKIKYENDWGSRKVFVGSVEFKMPKSSKLLVKFPDGHEQTVKISSKIVTETVSDMGRKSETVSVIPVAVFDYHGTTIQQPLHEIKNILVAESE